MADYYIYALQAVSESCRVTGRFQRGAIEWSPVHTDEMAVSTEIAPLHRSAYSSMLM